MPQDAPGRKHKATLRANGSRNHGLFWHCTHALAFGYEILCLTKKAPDSGLPSMLAANILTLSID
jgi:hypothetical protein